MDNPHAKSIVRGATELLLGGTQIGLGLAIVTGPALNTADRERLEQRCALARTDVVTSRSRIRRRAS